MCGSPRANNSEILYEDDADFVLNILDPELIELGFLNRGMNLNFGYAEWRNLRRIIAGIELPESLSEETVALYEDDAYLFTADDELVRWIIAEAKKCWEKAKASLSERGITDFTLRIGSSGDDPVALKIIEVIGQFLGEVGIRAEQERNLDRADALVEAVGFHRPRMVYSYLHSPKESGKTIAPWGYKKSYMDHLLDNVEGMDTYWKIQEMLTAERIFIPLFRRGMAVTYARDLDTKSKLRVSNLLYGSDVVHWEFKH